MDHRQPLSGVQERVAVRTPPPVPVRDPADERRRLVTVSPGHLLEIEHYLFAGRLDLGRRFRALFADAATGDGCIMLARQLARAGAADAEVVYADPSPEARAVAEARAQTRGLGNVRFLTASTEDLHGLNLGRFDYVDSGASLAHAAVPAKTLGALVKLASPDGGLGLTAPGALGQTGLAPLRAALDQLAGEDSPADRLMTADRLVRDLPPSNWARRNPQIKARLDPGTAELADFALTPRQNTWRVIDLAALIEAAGLEIVRFLEPVRYEPRYLLEDPAVLDRLSALPDRARWAFAEALTGTIDRHVCYAVPRGRAPNCVAGLADGDPVPVLRGTTGEALAQAIVEAGGRLPIASPSLTLTMALPPLAGAIAARIGGRRSVRQIFEDQCRTSPGLDWLAFRAQFDPFYETLNAANLLFLSHQRH